MIEKIKAVMIGHAVGDALGVPVEFASREEVDANPVEDMEGFGTYPYKNAQGDIKVECERCHVVMVRKIKGRRHDTIDLYAPKGQERMPIEDLIGY